VHATLKWIAEVQWYWGGRRIGFHVAQRSEMIDEILTGHGSRCLLLVRGRIWRFPASVKTLTLCFSFLLFFFFFFFYCSFFAFLSITLGPCLVVNP